MHAQYYNILRMLHLYSHTSYLYKKAAKRMTKLVIAKKFRYTSFSQNKQRADILNRSYSGGMLKYE